MKNLSSFDVLYAVDELFDTFIGSGTGTVTSNNNYVWKGGYAEPCVITTANSPKASIKYSAPAFPPADVILDEDNNLNFTFALAGYKKDELEISFDGDYMILTGKPETVEEKEETKAKILKKSIKKTDFEYKYLAPLSKFNQDNASADFENGLLKVVIPAVDKRDPIKINVK